MSGLKPTRTGMVQRFSLWVRIFFVWIYARVFCEPKQIQDIKALPSEESLIYVLESDNKHDFLYLNYLCLKHALPLAVASNGKGKRRFSSLWLLLRALFGKHKKKQEQAAFLAQCVRERKPVLLFLHTPGGSPQKNAAALDIFETLSQIRQSDPTLKPRFLTTTIIWERRAENLKHTFFNEIYGTPTRPSSVRRFLSVIPGLHQLFFKIGTPLCLIGQEQAEHSKLSGAQLKELLQQSIDRARETVLGPKLKPHQVLKQEILTSSDFITDIEALSQETGQSVEALLGEAHKILNKTASKFSFLMVKIFCTLLTPIWSLIYNGLYIERETLSLIRELSKTHRIVFVPSHKSHIDYLVLSYLLFQYGLMPPHIVAGENLNFQPIGAMLRRGGAFFIKRSFKGEQLYALCVQHYISKLLLEGYPLEFFIEGGRSRTGQVMQPKYGILRMIAKTGMQHPELGIVFIPTAITYEKVIEDQSYQKEQSGKKKNKENISNLIKTTKVLISKYGQLYTSFGQPVDLQDYFPNEPLATPMDEKQCSEAVERLGLDIVQQINRASTITISALLSTALLNAETENIDLQRLRTDAAFILSILLERESRISPTLKLALASHRAAIHDPDPKSPPQEGSDSKIDSIATAIGVHLRQSLRLMVKNDCVSFKKDHVTINRGERLQLAFYKNSLLYSLIDEIYAAAAILCCDAQLAPHNASTSFFQIAQLFSYEFVPCAVNMWEEALVRFEQRDWLQPETQAPTPDGLVALNYLKRCLRPFALAYLQTARALNTLKSSETDEDKFLEALLEDKNEGFDQIPEARSTILLSHALQKFVSLGHVKIIYKQIGKKTHKRLCLDTPPPPETMQLLEALSK